MLHVPALFCRVVFASQLKCCIPSCPHVKRLVTFPQDDEEEEKPASKKRKADDAEDSDSKKVSRTYIDAPILWCLLFWIREVFSGGRCSLDAAHDFPDMLVGCFIIRVGSCVVEKDKVVHVLRIFSRALEIYKRTSCARRFIGFLSAEERGEQQDLPEGSAVGHPGR